MRPLEASETIMSAHLSEMDFYEAAFQSARQCNAVPALIKARKQMVSNGRDNVGEEKNVGDAPHAEMIRVSLAILEMTPRWTMLAKFDLNKFAKLAKAKGTKVAKTLPPTRDKGIHIGERSLKRAKTF
ncbi:hypothetical protein Acr_24g0006100 [Actinidia rufa]|uniref:Uncharacterized protein n=1 Tax=Actinidia rufa TaxID=165716 RepID=A0A7J0GUA7_9ERIC|nr:hypothetical protein Acr_24g0006100 [Actinidia rufa]